jgi:hypothetical protein
MQVQQNERKKAVMMETITAISQALNEGNNVDKQLWQNMKATSAGCNGLIADSSAFYNYLGSKLNHQYYTVWCGTTYTATNRNWSNGGCFTTGGGEGGWIQMKNGATISDLDYSYYAPDTGKDNYCSIYEIMDINWDGAAGNNVVGDDIFQVIFQIQGDGHITTIPGIATLCSKLASGSFTMGCTSGPEVQRYQWLTNQ